jgi:signal transduction histidine kinase
MQVALYRISQEALNNVARHSGATRAEVNLNCQPEQVTLQIRDNGRGFDPGKIPPGHLGLGIMRERAGQIEATLKINSQPGGGTEILVIWPEAEEPG